MKKNKKIIAVVGSLLLIAVGASVYAGSRTEVLNDFATGVVDIEITEYQAEGEQEVKWRDDQTIMPGRSISKIPRIKNVGSSCYVRAKLIPSEDGTRLENCIYGMDENWLEAPDGYFYYREILAAGDTADLFQGIKIPADFSQEYTGKILHLGIDVDAVQSQNFTPDFEADSPWGELKILKCEKEGQYNINSYEPAQIQSFQVEYEGESGNLITNTQDFFANFPVLFPGDEYSDSAVLKNNSDTELNLYFRTATPENSVLLDEIQLKILSEIAGKTEVVYEGNLREKELTEGTLLGTIPANASGKLDFTIKVPSEADNDYSALRSYVKWIFSSDFKKETVPERPVSVVKTGDEIKGMLFLGAAAVMAVMVFILTAKQNYGKKRV